MRAVLQLVVSGIVTGACALAVTATADAAEGRWNANRGCPVDAPAMLAAPAGTDVRCVWTTGNGPLKIGNVSGDVSFNALFGAIGPDPATAVSVWHSWSLSYDGFNRTWQAPVGPICMGGGMPPRDALLGVVANLVSTVCGSLWATPLGQAVLFASIEPAGPPSGFRVAGASGTGPVMTLPIKLRVRSDLLGFTCTVGSDAAPIVVRLTAAGPPARHDTQPDPNGYPVTFDSYTGGGAFSDTSFAVPGASGCGSGGTYDGLVNTVLGVPSASGSNTVSIGRGAFMHSTTAGGAVLSQAYHAALG